MINSNYFYDMKQTMVYLILPWYYLCIHIDSIISGQFPIFKSIDIYKDYFNLSWTVSKSKLQIKFGLCKKYTFTELKESFLK